MKTFARLVPWLVVAAIIAALFYPLARAHAADTSPTARYRLRNEATADAPFALIVRHDCLASEDSAAHLIVREYSDDWAVLSCRRRGY